VTLKRRIEYQPVRRLELGAFALALVAVLASGGQASAVDKIKFGLNWIPQAEQCGFFQAREDGTYAAAGLEVELVPGGPGMSMPQLTAAGVYDLAMGSALTTLAMRNNDIPGVTVAAMLQKTGASFVAHPDVGIKTLEDFKGKPIQISNIARGIQWAWVKAKYGFDDSQLRPYVYSPQAFAADKNVSTQGFATEDGYVLGQALGVEPVVVLLADYGFPDYATTIFTMQETIDTKGDMVRRFVEASIKGFDQCMNHDPSKAIAAMQAANPLATPELSHYKLDKMKSYEMVMSGDAAKYGVGAMSDERWKVIFDTMSDLGLYPKTLDYKTAYTLEFTNLGIGVKK
jgi:NitT/TauT family transport system substrate-binding protein